MDFSPGQRQGAATMQLEAEALFQQLWYQVLVLSLEDPEMVVP